MINANAIIDYTDRKLILHAMLMSIVKCRSISSEHMEVNALHEIPLKLIDDYLLSDKVGGYVVLLSDATEKEEISIIEFYNWMIILHQKKMYTILSHMIGFSLGCMPPKPSIDWLLNPCW